MTAPAARTRSTTRRLARPAARVVDLAEPRRDRHDRARAHRERGVDRLLERSGRQRDHDELGLAGQLGERAVRLAAENLAALAVDEPDVAPVSASQRSGSDPLTPLGRVVRGTETRRPSVERRAVADRARA